LSESYKRGLIKYWTAPESARSGPKRAPREESEMRKQLVTTAIAAACFVLGAGGATLYSHADTGPAVFDIFENNVTDEATYKAALPDVIKMIKDNGGEYIAGGFNKTKRVQQDETDAREANSW
jgi:hypothetical protein